MPSHVSTTSPLRSPSVPPLRIAFLGLGVMGSSMAEHLARKGHDVVVYNRTSAKAQAWVDQHGGHLAHSAAEAARGASIVMSCVGNDDDVRAMTLGAQGSFQTLSPGAVHVDHTTTSATLAEELAHAATQRGFSFMDAPVSGGNVGAQQGTLTVMCGGERSTFERVQPVLHAYAKAVTHLGRIGNGQRAKMVNQICIAGIIQGLAEALAFGHEAGLDMAAVLPVLGQGAAQSWQMDHRGPTMIRDEFDVGFAVDLMRKDLALALDQARRQGSSLPLTALVDQFYADLQTLGGGRWDTSSLVRRLRRRTPST